MAYRTPIFLLLTFTALFFSGCSTTPEERRARAKRLYEAAQAGAVVHDALTNKQASEKVDAFKPLVDVITDDPSNGENQ